MLFTILLLTFLMVAFFCSTARAAQLYKKEDLKTWDREDVAGGTGKLAGQFSFTRHDAAAEHSIKEIGWMTLQPGESVGMHKHDSNEDAYIIVSGEGTFTDTNGLETKVKAGDITMARRGESHALANTGTVPMVFLDVIAE